MSTLTQVTRATAKVEAAEEQLAQAVLAAREDGASWAEIAEAQGITRQAAWKRWGRS